MCKFWDLGLVGTTALKAHFSCMYNFSSSELNIEVYKFFTFFSQRKHLMSICVVFTLNYKWLVFHLWCLSKIFERQRSFRLYFEKRKKVFFDQLKERKLNGNYSKGSAKINHLLRFVNPWKNYFNFVYKSFT